MKTSNLNEHKEWIKTANDHIKSWENLAKQLNRKKSNFTFDKKPLRMDEEDIPKEKKNVASQLKFWYNLKKQHQKALNKLATKTVWQKHQDGGEIMQYKFGSITRYNKNYQINYFGTIGMISENASSLVNAKQKLDKISQSKIKKQSPMKAPAAKTAKRKKVISAKKICRMVIDVPGINKRTGQLLKGWHYVKGKAVKVTKKPAKKKGLGKVEMKTCTRRNPDGSSTTYSSHGGSRPCPYGGLENNSTNNALAGAKKAKTPAQKAFAINSKKARALVTSGKAKTLKSAWAMIK